MKPEDIVDNAMRQVCAKYCGKGGAAGANCTGDAAACAMQELAKKNAEATEKGKEAEKKLTLPPSCKAFVEEKK